MLQIKHLNKYIGDKHILNNISLNVAKGEIAVLLGASGVGKSTLLKVLNNLETPTSGTVELDGKELDLSQINKNHTIGMVFQHFNLFDHLNVIENITLALIHVAHKSKQQAETIAADLLKKYGLYDKQSARISELSGGQKQRLAIARTLALQPKIICFDEPTSALDPLLTSYVAENIQELAAQGYSIVVTTHDIGLLKKLKATIYLMEKGSIVESTDSEEFFKDPIKKIRISGFIKGVI